MKEQQRHKDAFEKYFLCKQNGKSVEEAIMILQRDCGATRATLYRWKKKFGWDDREAVRASGIQKEVVRKVDSCVVDNKVRYLNCYHRLLDNLEGNFSIRIENVNDLDKVVKGALLLQGESTDRTEQQGGGLDGLAESIKKSFEVIKKD